MVFGNAICNLESRSKVTENGLIIFKEIMLVLPDLDFFYFYTLNICLIPAFSRKKEKKLCKHPRRAIGQGHTKYYIFYYLLCIYLFILISSIMQKQLNELR
jgi:hypothetical protein